MVEPAVQEDLHSIILRFCMHKIVFSANIVKMYRQTLKRIIWRPSDSNLNCHPLKTPQGACSNRSGMKPNYPVASEIATRDFYVYDIISGREIVTQALRIQQELIQMMKCGFQLRKWSSNVPELLHCSFTRHTAASASEL
ncbi:hypothetical protein PR048_006725 [Dryococelus australis]|uniref:Uncharacterized protein n=1 Tax=Dryococelus australis TaxID=614101 RepID=A0ABQ9ID29_9NEOP|nr:hypothetical protein PR048_006725 [Dryococelus australis]